MAARATAPPGPAGGATSTPGVASATLSVARVGAPFVHHFVNYWLGVNRDVGGNVLTVPYSFEASG